MAARRLAPDGDLGVAKRDDAEQPGDSDTADRDFQGVKVMNTNLPLSPSKLADLQISIQARPAPIRSATPSRSPAPNRQRYQRDLRIILVVRKWPCDVSRLMQRGSTVRGK